VRFAGIWGGETLAFRSRRSLVQTIRPKEDCHAFHAAAGLCRSSSLAGDHVWFHQGRPPRNKGLRYPPDPPTVEEIIAVMRVAGDGADSLRLRAVIAVLWRAG
jgi:integrase